MRVSLGTQSENVIAQIRRAAAQLQETQNIVSTGKRITRPSDDPVGMARALDTRSALSRLEQFHRDGIMADTLLDAADVALTTISDGLKKAHEIAIAAGNAALEPEARQAYISELRDIEDRILDALNTRQMDRYIFAGYATDKAPFVVSGGPNPYEYVGDNGVLSIQVYTGSAVPVSIPGNVVANTNGAANPDVPDIFTTLRNLMNDVQNGDTAQISENIGALDAHFSNILHLRSEVGARINRVEDLGYLTEDATDRLRTLLSETEDADITQAIVDLKTQEQVYESALAVAARIMQTSLLDWLK